MAGFKLAAFRKHTVNYTGQIKVSMRRDKIFSLDEVKEVRRDEILMLLGD